ncbi:MAG: hypothetical protein K1W33_06100 [Clostridia bacterium]
MQKKKSYLAIIAIVALIILLATGYTFSKFYQSVKGKGTMNIATWAFKATTNDNRPLSEIILQEDNGGPVLPGSKGSFDITVDATGSAVDIAYSTKVTDENLPESMIFYMENDKALRYQDFRDLALDKIKGTLSPTLGTTATYKVCWEWPFDGNDLIDNSSSNNYNFNIEIIGEQVKK